jgi:hypothetical protein
LATPKVPLEIEEAFKLVMLAPENVAVLDPVPPLAIAKVPLVIEEAFNDVRFAPLKAPVFDPVPPDATGRGLANTQYPAELTVIAVVPPT